MTLIQLNDLSSKLIADSQVHSDQFRSNIIQFKSASDTVSPDSLSHDCELYCEIIPKGQTTPQCAYCPFWHQVHYAWELVQKNRFQQAYNLLCQSQTNLTERQGFVAKFVVAIVDSLYGNYPNAENVLAQAPDFFYQHQDTEQLFSAQIHLAYLYLCTGRSEYAHRHIEQALQWLNKMDITAQQIRWWHPEAMSHTLAYAIAHSIQPDIARGLFMLQIGRDGKDALLPYLYKDDATVRRNAYNFYRIFDDTILELVSEITNLRVKQIIHELLQDGVLSPEGFSYLKKTLTTAARQHSPNTTLIATFGLYMARYSRREIAERLDMSLSSIRNYITTIYEIFNLDLQSYSGRQARFQHLLEIAREKGYIT